MRGDGRRALSGSAIALVAVVTTLAACGSACTRPPAPSASSSPAEAACPSDRFTSGFVPAARDASAACKAGDVLACDQDCDQGLAYGCVGRARFEEDGGDPDAATRAHERACRLGAMASCTAVAERATKSPDDMPAACARALLDTACAGREPRACGLLGLSMARGIGAPPERGRARRLLEDACDALAGFPCHVLGVLLRERAFGDVDRAAEESALRRGCASGVSRSCLLLADPAARDDL